MSVSEQWPQFGPKEEILAKALPRPQGVRPLQVVPDAATGRSA